MKLKLLRIFLFFCLGTLAPLAIGQKDPYVGDVPMSPKKTLLENLAASPINTVMVQGLRATQLDQRLGTSGPYTVFVPTDDAFRNLGRTSGTSRVATTPGLPSQEVMTYHVVQGRLTSKKLYKLIKKSHGTATLQTLAGLPLTVRKYGSILVLTDAKGGTAAMVTADVLSKGGVFHVIDAVLMPR